MTSGPDTRLSLLVRLQVPTDQEAWREFVGIYQPLIHRLAVRGGLQDADAQEVTQEVLLAVAGALDRWEPDSARASFRTWLFRIARNVTINWLKKRQRRPLATGGTDMVDLLHAQVATDHDSVRFDHELRREIFRSAAEKIRGEFRESTWQAFWRTSVEGDAIPRVASEMNLSVGAIYVARSRVMARLRQIIEQLDLPGPNEPTLVPRHGSEQPW